MRNLEMAIWQQVQPRPVKSFKSVLSASHLVRFNTSTAFSHWHTRDRSLTGLAVLLEIYALGP